MNIAIVTGASSGLGAGYVRELDQGKLIKEKLDEIWVIARREDRLCALGKEVQTPLRILPLDLRKNESLGILQALLSSLRPDVRLLINAAGYGKIGSWKDISLEDASGMIDLNCRAAVCMTQTALPFMKKGARIMEICSTAAFQPFPYLGIYSASKSFLLHYSRALGKELKKSGISVTAVCPYWVKDTGRSEGDDRRKYDPFFSAGVGDRSGRALVDDRCGASPSGFDARSGLFRSPSNVGSAGRAEDGSLGTDPENLKKSCEKGSCFPHSAQEDVENMSFLFFPSLICKTILTTALLYATISLDNINKRY